MSNSASKSSQLPLHIVVNDGLGFRLESYATIDEVVEAMTLNTQEDASAFVIRGEVIHTSQGPWRFLLTDPPRPLFQPPQTPNLVPDPSGYLGTDYVEDVIKAEDSDYYAESDAFDDDDLEEWGEDDELPE